MTEKNLVSPIDAKFDEKLWQPVVQLKSGEISELVTVSRLATHAEAMRAAEKEAQRLTAKEDEKPASARKAVEWFGARHLEEIPPSQKQLRPLDSRLVNIDRLAQEIVRAMGLTKSEFGLKVMTIENAVFAKAKRGEIQLYCEDRPFPFDRDENESMHGGLRLTRSDADELRTFYLDSLSDPLAPPPNQGPDYAMLASREQLIEAFGRFTGMNKDWFNHLKDLPKLANARQVKGHGGRGHIAEPLFCPYEVLCWLIHPKRKKGRELSEDKGWELLERYFPKVYNAKSVGDKRPI